MKDEKPLKTYAAALVDRETGEPHWGYLPFIDAPGPDWAARGITEHIAMYLHELGNTRTLAIRETIEGSETIRYQVWSKATFNISVDRIS